ncbi:MAG: hypothetical protein GKR97_17640 [Rhizobiaceae bacterium]|nr:hypothetical protein [Rhizobiaceae bacterium]
MISSSSTSDPSDGPSIKASGWGSWVVTNFYLFGLNAKEVVERRSQQDFARRAIEASPRLTRVLNQIADGEFSPAEPQRYAALVRSLYEHDYFLVSCDFDDYFNTQRAVDKDYNDVAGWTRKCIYNTARMGWFSSDRTIESYAKGIWNVVPSQVT